MATMAAAAILTRIREVIVDSRGTLRTVPSARFLGDLPGGLPDESELARSAEKPRIEASITRVAVSPASPPVTGDLRLYDLTIEVRVIRALSSDEQVQDSQRDALRALAIEDADVLAQALCWPGNVLQTQALVATGLCSGILRYTGSEVSVRREVAQGAQIVETIHRFMGVAQSRPS